MGKIKGKKPIYMKITADNLELPLYIDEDLDNFCQKLGITRKRCWNIMAKPKQGQRRGYRIVKVLIDSEEIEKEIE